MDAHVAIPGSKSLTNRWLVLAALASSPTRLTGALASRDSRLMIDALTELGASFEADGETLIVTPISFNEHGATTERRGHGRRAARDNSEDLLTDDPLVIHCGLAGTVMRFVPAVAALHSGPVRFIGDDTAGARPMAPLLDGLEQQGVRIDREDPSASLPFTVNGTGSLRGGVVEIDSSGSSQFVSGLLLAGVRGEAPLTVRQVGDSLPSIPHIDMTVALLQAAGITAEHRVVDGRHEWTVEPGEFEIGDITIEPDLSNAGPFIAAAVATGGCVSVANWPEHTTQPGQDFTRILPMMGAEVERIGSDVEFSGTGRIRGIDIDLSSVGELTPTIAALAVLADSPSHLRGIKHLRGHETDRVAALATELRRLGADVVEHEGSLEITPKPLTGCVMETYEDHRMATAAAIIGLKVPDVRVVNVATTQKTLPDFVGMWLSMLHAEARSGGTW
nr:3-phosphoshikimate 1-carboxyvinyltransferase [Helcobacillus massiliensis]